MKRTPLHDCHIAAGAKLVDFAGWEMPIQYSGVIDEYQAVRQAAGLFDVSHMGRISVSGSAAVPYLQHVTTNDVAALQTLQSQYSMVCNPDGGIKDDVFVYKLNPDDFLVCVNASNRPKIAAWFQDEARKFSGVTVEDRSDSMAQLALQGPRSRETLVKLGLPQVESLKARHGVQATLGDVTMLITRTGYTGELGYELYLPASQASALWSRLMAQGKGVGVKPAGLGSRDLLRLEMAYLLYGNDISEDTTPLEAGAGWIVSFDKGDFVGREVLQRQKETGVDRRLVAFELLQKGVPRHGFKIVASNGRPGTVGEVTSGNFSPLLQKGIGLAYVRTDMPTEGSSLAVDIRGKLVPAKVVKPPFYKRRRN